MANRLQSIQAVSLDTPQNWECQFTSFTAVGKGTGDWASAYAKAAAMVSKMTLEEKVGH
jgi:hypothetical protein